MRPLWYRSGPGRVDGPVQTARNRSGSSGYVERTLAMRYLLLSSAVLLIGTATLALGRRAERGPFISDSVVLEQIKTSNPQRYARIRDVMASASEMCKPNAARSWQLTSVQPADCSKLFLKTSYPPKRQISFDARQHDLHRARGRSGRARPREGGAGQDRAARNTAVEVTDERWRYPVKIAAVAACS